MARKVLLADDSVTAQNMGRKILTEAGYEVITVNNGSAALKKINELKPDLIVLDVYMPGYGGLEICQRLKENAETARIPVLLTVGKLEPFKAEDARRVRADMHMIKPFEASELLTALTRLEDRIVPQGPVKGRKSRGNADDTSSDTERFGDDEAGWKNRIIMPKAKSAEAESHPEPEPEVAASKSQSLRDLLAMEDKAPHLEEPKYDVEAAKAAAAAAAPVDAPASKLPQDITPEEIAAIAAAAAAFQRVEPPIANAPPVTSVPAPGLQAAPQDLANSFQRTKPEAEPAPQTQPEAATLASGLTFQAPSISLSKNSVLSPVVAEPVALPVKEELPMTPQALRPTITQETPAQIADNATAAELAPPSTAARVENLEAEEVAAALAGIGPSASVVEHPTVSPSAGVRWIAEPAAVSVQESRTALALEMEKAYSALVPTEANASGFSLEPLDEMSFAPPRQFSLDLEAQTFTLSHEPAAMRDSALDPGPSVAVEQEQERKREQEIASPIQQSAPAETPAPIITAIASVDPVEATETPEEISSEKETRASFAATEAASSAPEVEAVTHQTEPVTVAATATVQSQSLEREELKEESPVTALAAAAAAGVTSASPAAPELTASAAPSPQPGVENVIRQKETELAAAWRSWREVSTPTAEATSKERFNTLREEPAPATSGKESKIETAEAPGDAEDISSIVDTMLAELKPKLMKEIARKMSKGKE